MLSSFPSGESTDEIVHNQTNYQGCQYDVPFFQCQMNDEEI